MRRTLIITAAVIAIVAIVAASMWSRARYAAALE
jgi:hypothetical protein